MYIYEKMNNEAYILHYSFFLLCYMLLVTHRKERRFVPFLVTSRTKQTHDNHVTSSAL